MIWLTDSSSSGSGELRPLEEESGKPKLPR